MRIGLAARAAGILRELTLDLLAADRPVMLAMRSVEPAVPTEPFQQTDPVETFRPLDVQTTAAQGSGTLSAPVPAAMPSGLPLRMRLRQTVGIN